MAIVELAEVIAEWSLNIISQYGILVGLLVLIGIFAVISAIGQKAWLAIRYLFMIFIAIPAILIVGIANKSYRKERLKDLGEIKAHLKSHPDKWKRLLYFGLLIVFIIIVVLIAWWFLESFIFPIGALNEYSRQMLSNSSNLTNGGLT